MSETDDLALRINSQIQRDKPSRPTLALTFFGLVIALSAPFWLLGALTNLQLMPGLSVSALMTCCPMLAAMILVHREQGRLGLTALLRRSFDFRRIQQKAWLAPVLLVMPGVSVMVYALMDLTGTPLPEWQVEPGMWLLLLLVFFVGALGEELGWSGYILEPLLQRWNALQASLILAAVGVAWHLIPLLLMQRPLAWISWWALYTLAARVLTVWLYTNTGRSVFAVALFHATLNASYMAFPIYGSHFDMRIGSLVIACVAAAVVVVWGLQLRWSPLERQVPLN
jgi:membrane protease YdiL (CAAX protease family)